MKKTTRWLGYGVMMVLFLVSSAAEDARAQAQVEPKKEDASIQGPRSRRRPLSAAQPRPTTPLVGIS